MLSDTPGVHHVTGTVGDAQENVDFYTGVLGLRLVRQTVNLNDILAYHLFYGNATGEPGTVFTTFPSRDAEEGRVGPPQPEALAFAVPEGSLDDWRDRLDDHGVDYAERERFGDETALAFADPDGTRLELVPTTQPVEPWTEVVPEETAIRGIFGVTVRSVNPYATASVLDTLGFDLVAEDDDRVRYRAAGDHAAVVDIRTDDVEGFGRDGTGTLHHVAVRVPDEDALHEWRELLADRDGLEVSRVKDRHVFHALYVREPGGILFELATEGPGLVGDQDEPYGEDVVLPGRLEEDRALVESQLPPLNP
ncbi:VOC family protein [Halocalculus aciditolerans]|uniref:Putative ring-cleaving dioxygenase MhqO n=1 Tax=Halocalculus aciditolerans TaxID=1383812 RepID=A0A830FCL6_9EURY|nr:VOC family protein [Halocalculus aciditolerans]GGL61595.1 putative ring-cleaving dioxygenase MhqO [Halocalculus aciditolerans]